MAKSTLDASQIAKMFGQSQSYTDAMLKKHSVTAVPAFRVAGDGLDGFYSDMTAIYNTEPSLTKQEFTEQCDPNYILERVIRGQDIQLSANPVYGDFTSAPTSYHEALNIVTQAKQSFSLLDAKLRARFDNDPGKFVDWLQDPAFQDEHIELGLAAAKPSAPSLPDVSAAPSVPVEGEKGEA